MARSPAELALPAPGDVRRLFDAASVCFDAGAPVHDETRARLLERLAYVRIDPDLILDLGSATGAAAEGIAGVYPRARVVAVDASAAMARAAAARARATSRPFAALRADALRLPLPADSADLVIANQLLPFVRPDRLFGEVARVLAPQGLFTFATVGPDTLAEVRRAWSAVDDAVHVHAFVDMHDLGDLAVAAGLAEPVLDVDRIRLSYRDAASIVRDLRACGAVNAAGGRRRGLTAPGRWRAFERALEAARVGERIEITVELILGHAWGLPARGRGRPGASGETAVPVEDLRRRR